MTGFGVESKPNGLLDAEEIRKLLNEGDIVTIEYKSIFELNNLNRSNIVRIERGSR